MTAIWGPMGWMTLHSISLIYPDTPTQNEKQILLKFLQDFAESITCPHCERHFKAMFENYRKTHPEWANSRFDLFLFVARAHNTVNKRLEKPQKKTVEECLDAITTGTQYTSAIDFRRKYIDYVATRMAAEMSGDSMIKVGHAQSMRRINESYWNSRIESDTSKFNMNANVLEPIQDTASSQRFLLNGMRPITIDSPTANPPQVGFSLRGGRLRLNVR